MISHTWLHEQPRKMQLCVSSNKNGSGDAEIPTKCSDQLSCKVQLLNINYNLSHLAARTTMENATMCVLQQEW
jgi:hypothetical protein